MRLYGAIQKVEPQDDGTVRVHGIATSEAVDDQGEIVRAEAIRAAIPDYMRFPALREMHQLSAAGTTLEAEVGDDGVTRIVAHVVDPVAVAKVKNQVYRGFSIGGRVTQRDAASPKTITGIVLNEISLVDRPANPEAIFDCWKAAPLGSSPAAGCAVPGQPPGNPGTGGDMPAPFNPPLSRALLGLTATGEASLRPEPIQIWACGVPDHQHLAKADALKCLQQRTAEGVQPANATLGLPASTEAPPRQDTAGASHAETAIGEAKKAIETVEGAVSALARQAAATSGSRVDGSNSTIDRRAGGSPGDEYADPGYQADGEKRYPIDSERHIRAAWSYIHQPDNARQYSADQVKRIKDRIIAVWKEKIDMDGPPSADAEPAAATERGQKASQTAVSKALWDVGRVAQVILDLDWVKDALEVEAAMEDDQSPQPARLEAIINELCDFLNALTAEETDEISNDAEIDGSSRSPAGPGRLAMATGAAGAARLATLLKTGSPKMQKLVAGLLAKAKHSQSDQVLVDIARYACDRCLEIDGLSAGAKEEMGQARDRLRAAGAAPFMEPTADKIRPDAAADTAKAAGGCTAALGKHDCAHQHLMDTAHDCLGKLTDGATCREVDKAGARHSGETMEHLRAAHRHLVAAGAECDTASIPASGPGTEALVSPAHGAAGEASLGRELDNERAEKAALVKALGEMVPMLDRLTKRVEDIARTPLPPLTIAKGTVSVSKQQDGAVVGAGDAALSPEVVAAAFAKMSKEEQTLTLIKASYANPIPVLGLSGGER
jgi:uncharacterized protein DUF6582